MDKISTDTPEQAWRRMLGFKMVRKDEENNGYYLLTVKPGYFLDFVRGKKTVPADAVYNPNQVTGGGENESKSTNSTATKEQKVEGEVVEEGDENEEEIPHISPSVYYGLRIKEEYYEKYLRGEEISKDVTVEVEMPVDRKHLSSHYAVHGGVIALLVDSTMGYAVFTVVKPLQLCSTIEFKISYFKPVLEGQIMVAQAKLLHVGRSHVTVECEVLVEGQAVAKAIGTFNLYTRSRM